MITCWLFHGVCVHSAAIIYCEFPPLQNAVQNGSVRAVNLLLKEGKWKAACLGMLTVTLTDQFVFSVTTARCFLLLWN